MKRAISVAEFALLRRQLPAQAFLVLVGQIENTYRKDLAHPYEQYSINSVDGSGFDLTPDDLTKVPVIRACMAVREAGDETRERDIERLLVLLAEFDPDRLLGTEQRRRFKAGGAKTAADRKAAAEKDDAQLAAAAKKELRANPGLTDSDIARRLAERYTGGSESIRKKLPGMLGRQRKKSW